MMLGTAIIRADGSGSPVAAAIGRNVKPHVSLVFYATAAGLAFVGLWISHAPFAAGRDVVRAAPPPQPMRALPAPVGRATWPRRTCPVTVSR
jgi:hypothetical protein